MGHELISRLRDLLVEPVESHGADLEDVALVGHRDRPVVKVTADSDGGLSLDQSADINRSVSQALDESDVMGNRSYIVEVTSPGVSRPLVLPRHWQRNVGRLVRIVFFAGNPVVGRIASADDVAAVVDIEGVEKSFSYSEIKRAVVQVELKQR